LRAICSKQVANLYRLYASSFERSSGFKSIVAAATESRLSQAERPLVSSVFAIRNSKGGDAGLYQTSQFSQSDDVAIDAEP